jgi:hypothetical protein
MSTPDLYRHQEYMADFATKHNEVLNTSDPGTGKTRGTYEGYIRRVKLHGNVGRLLVVAPLSILEPSWGEDCRKFTHLGYAVAHGGPAKRMSAFKSDAPVVLINHDGIKWLVHKKGNRLELRFPELLEGFTDLIIDEFTAFKHRASQRSKAMLLVSQHFAHKTLLSGTPTANTVLDIWHPALILDGGRRLGSRFFQFRSQVCRAEQVGPLQEHVKWVDKPGAEEAVADALSDITIRFELEKCIDMPEHVERFMYVDAPPKLLKAYKDMQNEAALETETGQVTAINAASRATKLLQILSGAVYDADGNAHGVHNARYDLVIGLVEQRKHSLVAFNWKHERDNLVTRAESAGITFAVIDGSVSAKERETIVKNYQAGEYQVLFCQPQSAAHGLTLTRGTTTIWSSPTYNPEHFKQFNRRIYRAGQTKRTETICIATRGTKEDEAYTALKDKMFRITNLLNILTDQTELKTND